MFSGGVALAACAPGAPPPGPTGKAPAGGIEPKLMIYGGSQDIATINPSDRVNYSIDAVTPPAL